MENAKLKIVIPIVPVSKKNSQRILRYGKTGRMFIAPSEKYEEYEKEALLYLASLKSKLKRQYMITKPIDYPVNVKCVFYMPTLRKCDLVNMQEAILDVLVKSGILDDDNYTIVTSMDGSRVDYDKKTPRTEIEITEVEINDTM